MVGVVDDDCDGVADSDAEGVTVIVGVVDGDGEGVTVMVGVVDDDCDGVADDDGECVAVMVGVVDSDGEGVTVGVGVAVTDGVGTVEAHTGSSGRGRAAIGTFTSHRRVDVVTKFGMKGSVSGVEGQLLTEKLVVPPGATKTAQQGRSKEEGRRQPLASMFKYCRRQVENHIRRKQLELWTHVSGRNAACVAFTWNITVARRYSLREEGVQAGILATYRQGWGYS